MTSPHSQDPIEQEMTQRLAACLAGIPAICDHRVCRRRGRCRGRDVPCFEKHFERILDDLAASTDTQNGDGDPGELAG